MAASLFFYDLETSGFNPRQARIMQFAGQRTDLELNPIGEPFNILVELQDDILPEPDAVLVTGITPQTTRADGITEAEFLKIFMNEVAVRDTIFVGYNTVRFDDEFMRYSLYRNFYDPYEWQWQDGRSRWDILDVVRMTRALRPEGINWPFDTKGKPTNRLEFLTSVNKLEHTDAHDALSDVRATIAVARLIHNRQPKLFTYLLEMRDKRKVAELVNKQEPFLYTSGQYPGEFEKTSPVVKLSDHSQKQGALVYDLRQDPTPFLKMTPAQLADIWRFKRDRAEDELRLPVKLLQYNRCPAVAPMGVADEATRQRLKLDMSLIQKHHKLLRTSDDFTKRVGEAQKLLTKEQQTQFLSSEQEVDAQLYDSFIPDGDKMTMSAIRASEPSDITDFLDKLQDKRLRALLPLYKARNFKSSLTQEELGEWEAFRHRKLTSGGQKSPMAKYFMRIQELLNQPELPPAKRYLLEELQLYGETAMPSDLDFEG